MKTASNRFGRDSQRRERFQADRRKEQVERRSLKKKNRQHLDSEPQPPGPASNSADAPDGAHFVTLSIPDPAPKYSPTTHRKSTRTRPRAPGRFSLRRLFYGNPLFPYPFFLGTAGPLGPGGINGSTPSSTRSRRTRGATSNWRSNYDGDSASERSVNPWRDTTSSGSPSLVGASSHNKSTTFIGPDGKPMRECSLCLVTLGLDNFPNLLNCHHLFCFECLKMYVKIELQEGRVNIRCPQCVEPLHPNDIELFIGDKAGNLQHLYECLMLRRILATDPDTRWCPGPNCTYGVIAAGCASCPKITCEKPGCGFSFCYHCKAEWHPNQTCDKARAQRQPSMRSSSVSFGQESRTTSHAADVKVCPRCDVVIVKMDDGSCNHMTCSICGAEFCWLCMKEISDLHYLSPSGCTFWGKKPWSRKKKLLWQLGTLVGAPVGIALLAGISIPAMIIGIPVWVGRKLYSQYNKTMRYKRNLIITGGVLVAILVSPVIAALAVSIGVPILLAYVYGVVPISLCRSEGCGVSTTSNGVKIDVEEDMPYRPIVMDNCSANSVPTTNNWNPSIGEMSLGASLSMGSASHLDYHAGSEADRESASNTAVAGTSRTVSLASSSVLGGGHSLKGVTFGCNGVQFQHPMGGQTRVEIGADVHHGHRKNKCSSSMEGLAETMSMRSAGTMSLMDPNQDGASTRGLAGSLLAYRTDTQSVHSFRTGGEPSDFLPISGDEISLKSLPVPASNTGMQPNSSHPNPRSLSPTVSCLSGDELSSGGGAIRRSTRKKTFEKQMSETSCLSFEDSTSERVRFDDNVSFMDEKLTTNSGAASSSIVGVACVNATLETHVDPPVFFSNVKVSKANSTSVVPEETAEELALVISPEPKRNFLSSFQYGGHPSSSCEASEAGPLAEGPSAHDSKKIEDRIARLVSVVESQDISALDARLDRLTKMVEGVMGAMETPSGLRPGGADGRRPQLETNDLVGQQETTEYSVRYRPKLSSPPTLEPGVSIGEFRAWRQAWTNYSMRRCPDCKDGRYVSRESS
eukprot:maker-scaffold496_size155344-snap-gene-0.25 protein:Tk03360 transcript:maker-scaffold496_size155344-snap-gene-0.25-mRNA-1 annotation:"ring finger"